jgi:acyl dehydratase
MTLNRDFIGRSCQSSEILEVTELMLREATQQLQWSHPAVDDLRAAHALGYAERIAPPVFAARLWFSMVSAWPMNDPGLRRKPGANFLLAELWLTQHRLIMVGDKLMLNATVKDIRELRSGREGIDVQSDVSTPEGELVSVTTFRMAVRREATFEEEEIR